MLVSARQRLIGVHLPVVPPVGNEAARHPAEQCCGVEGKQITGCRTDRDPRPDHQRLVTDRLSGLRQLRDVRNREPVGGLRCGRAAFP